MRLHILLLSFIVLASSCGKSNDKSRPRPAPVAPPSSEPTAETAPQNPTEAENEVEVIMPDGSNINGIYAATLAPVNNNIHLLKLGAAAIQREGDAITATVRLKYGQRETLLKQSIFSGSRCPTPADDLNKDAYIDINEALKVIGDVIVPLDGVLDSQSEGSNGYPTGDNIRGSYFYKITGSFSRMFADLKLPDTNPKDYVMKLKPEEGLSLDGKIIILQGLDKKKFLPPTVESFDGQSPFKTIPVACGVLKKSPGLPTELTEAI